MERIETITGTGIPLFLDDIDTDRIIPARYLRCVTFDGLGEHAFEDDREQDRNHPFDDPRFQNGTILVAGRNFGCGSSREHAPQALMRWGIQAVVAESFAEIFFGNCISLGIPAVRAGRADLEKLAAVVQASPATELCVDLLANTVSFGDESVGCEMPESARDALASGQWDFLAQLLDAESLVEQTGRKIPYLADFAVENS